MIRILKLIKLCRELLISWRVLGSFELPNCPLFFSFQFPIFLEILFYFTFLLLQTTIFIRNPLHSTLLHPSLEMLLLLLFDQHKLGEWLCGKDSRVDLWISNINHITKFFNLNSSNLNSYPTKTLRNTYANTRKVNRAINTPSIQPTQNSGPSKHKLIAYIQEQFQVNSQWG